MKRNNENETTTLFFKVMERFTLFNRTFGIVIHATRHIPRVRRDRRQSSLLILGKIKRIY